MKERERERVEVSSSKSSFVFLRQFVSKVFSICLH